MNLNKKGIKNKEIVSCFDMILAIDPGQRGAVCYGKEDGISVSSCMHFQPKHFRIIQGKKKIFSKKFSEDLASFSDVKKVIIEHQQPFPSDSPVTSFSIALLYASLIHSTVQLFPGAEIYSMRPMEWQRTIMMHSDALLPSTKETAIHFAKKYLLSEQLIPRSCRNPHDGIADAFCLYFAYLHTDKEIKKLFN